MAAAMLSSRGVMQVSSSTQACCPDQPLLRVQLSDKSVCYYRGRSRTCPQGRHSTLSRLFCPEEMHTPSAPSPAQHSLRSPADQFRQSLQRPHWQLRSALALSMLLALTSLDLPPALRASSSQRGRRPKSRLCRGVSRTYVSRKADS